MAILVNSTFDPFFYKDYSEFIQPKVEDKDLTRLNSLQTDIYKAKDLLDPNKDADIIEDLNTLTTWIDESADKVLNGSPQIANYQDYLAINGLFQDRISGLNAKYADRARRRAALTDDIITDLDLYGPLSEYNPEQAANAKQVSRSSITNFTSNMIKNYVNSNLDTEAIKDPETGQIFTITTGGFTQEDIDKAKKNLDDPTLSEPLKNIINEVRNNYEGNWSPKSRQAIDQAIKNGLTNTQYATNKTSTKNAPRTSGTGGGSSSKSSDKVTPGWNVKYYADGPSIWSHADENGKVDTSKNLQFYKGKYYNMRGQAVQGPYGSNNTELSMEEALKILPNELPIQQVMEKEKQAKTSSTSSKAIITPPTPPVKNYYYTASGQHDTNQREINKIKEQGRVIKAEEIPTRYAEKIAKDFTIKDGQWSTYLDFFNKNYTIYELDGHITLVPKKRIAPESAALGLDLGNKKDEKENTNNGKG